MKKKIIALTIIGFLIIVALVLGIMFFFRDEEEEIQETVTLDTIEGYSYLLEDRDNKVYEEEFKKLKNILESETINYQEYAKSIAKLFIIDLYTLENKINKYDVGGIEFLLEENKENFLLKAEDTLYKYLEDDTYNTREQDLPEVKTIEITDSVQSTFLKGEVEYPSYEISLIWTYKEANEYDVEGKVTVIQVDDKLYVVQKEEINEVLAS